MLFNKNDNPELTRIERTLSAYKDIPESEAMDTLLAQYPLKESDIPDVQAFAKTLILEIRARRQKSGGLDAFMAEYSLSNEEGIALMCIAEALLRIPDAETRNELIRDKIVPADWDAHAGNNASWFVNRATWSLMLTGQLLDRQPLANASVSQTLTQLLGKHSEPIIRQAMQQGMKIISKQYVKGQSITDALHRSKSELKKGYLFSYDMLGEAAKTELDAVMYFSAYMEAIEEIGAASEHLDLYKSQGISVKLSALHPRYELAKEHRLMQLLYTRLHRLAERCAYYNIGMTIDAEEADRLEISLKLIEKLATDSALSEWNGLGLAIQTYQKRAPYLIDWCIDLHKKTGKRLMLRIVKGAYWDSEIKWAQERGLDGYPVFTKKQHTDISYLVCVKKCLDHPEAIFGQFATHNAYTLASVLQIAGDFNDFEFQCLHGMGDTLYDPILADSSIDVPCRIYAPVGNYKSLLAYLVRRLLENGANASFVNRIIDDTLEVEDLTKDPAHHCKQHGTSPHPSIPLPKDLYGDRLNAKSIDLNHRVRLMELDAALSAFKDHKWSSEPLVLKASHNAFSPTPVRNPAKLQEIVGEVRMATLDMVDQTVLDAHRQFKIWRSTPVAIRAQVLRRFADLMETYMPELLTLLIREAGKTLPNAIAEVREAVDFCRYYADEAIRLFETPDTLPGPTGESNILSRHGRGVMVCISPWNFPLAIFIGQITAALAAGNTVIAKPAPQTCLIAHRALSLLEKAGLPHGVCQCLPGSGEIGAALINHTRIDGVIFTGSTTTAKNIERALAQKPGAIVPLIAETGGQNAMIVDSSALLEQVVTDIVQSAFDSAGQRCSALRVLFVQEDIAEPLIEMLNGAMDELAIGDPSLLDTDIGPVIDQTAKSHLDDHIEHMKREYGLLNQRDLSPEVTECGTFVPPTLIEIPHISAIGHEVFGPILHVVRYKSDELASVIDQINSTGFGLTFGIHSRIQNTIDFALERVNAGNLYVNRNTVGAIVGVQPFGGEGLSGTGPKAGGPWYLPRLSIERTVSTNTTALGGNPELMGLIG